MAYPSYSYPAYNTYQLYTPPRFDAQQYNVPQIPQSSPQTTQIQGNINSNLAVQSGFVCRPVTSREEALAVQTEYFSAGTLMPDLGHGMMYLKRFNQSTGASDFFEFKMVQPDLLLEESASTAAPSPDYLEIFREFSEQLAAMSERIDSLSSKMDALKPSSVSRKVVVEK